MKVLDYLGLHLSFTDPFGFHESTSSHREHTVSKGSRRLSGENRLNGPAAGDAGLAEGKKIVQWVNHSWFSHVLLFTIQNIWGVESLLLLKAIVLFCIGMCLLITMRRLGIHPLISSPVVAFVLLQGRSFWDIQPHLLAALCLTFFLFAMTYFSVSKRGFFLLIFSIVVIWANIHGSFLVGLALLLVQCSVFFLINFLPEQYFRIITREQIEGIRVYGVFIFLVLMCPLVFSPFGIENYRHLFMVNTGESGTIWRSFAAWHPLLATGGFENVKPYVFFIVFFTAVFLGRLTLLVLDLKKRRGQASVQSSHKISLTISLSSILSAVIAMYLPFVSRRFVPFSMIILAPILAFWFQDILQVIIQSISQGRPSLSLFLKRKHSVIRNFLALGLLGVSLFIASVFSQSWYYLYVCQSSSEEGFSPFEIMTRMDLQPVRAMQFMTRNLMQGVVLNEWAAGGYIASKQVWNPGTKGPLNKVYIDGRAEAAYSAEELQRWQQLMVLNPADVPHIQQQMYEFAAKIGLNTESPDFHKSLVKQLSSSPEGKVYLNAFAGGDSTLKRELNKVKFKEYLLSQNINPGDSGAIPRLLQKGNRDPSILTPVYAMFQGNPELYGRVLENAGVKFVLIPIKKYFEMFSLLIETWMWQLIYVDGEQAIFVSHKAPVFFQGPGQQNLSIKYPDELSRYLTESYRIVLEKKKDELQKLYKKLLSFHGQYNQILHLTVFEMSRSLQSPETVIGYFATEFQLYRNLVDKGKYGPNLKNIEAVISSLDKILALSSQDGKSGEEISYKSELDKYTVLHRNISEKVYASLLW